MALQAKAIKQKIKGVGNIKKITRTMEMVSVSKMKKAVASVFLVREYSSALTEVITHISKKSSYDSVYTKSSGGKKLLVIVASNKGLAGSYNTLIYKKTLEFLKNELDTGTIECITIGKQAEKIAKRAKLTVKASFIHFKDIPTFDESEALFSYINDIWKSMEYASASIIYTSFVRAGTFTPTIKQLLPISHELLEHHSDDGGGEFVETLFEPSEDYILHEVLPRLLETDVYTILTESAASEHSSRMLAMKTASDNATELQRVLTISYNRARQDAVTQELAEISAASL